MKHDSFESLRTRHQQLADASPKLRIRERALRLGVPEAALVAAECGVTSQELAGPAQALFRELGTLGRVMALSRNDSAVHERHGTYFDIQADGPVGIVLGPDIDLRMFFASWKYFYAVT
jgi:putative hemin transport protein